LLHARTWPEESSVPTGWAVFGRSGEIVRDAVDQDRKIGHWSEFETGGHFAAVEAPDQLVDDIRKFFRGLR
jgi:epoxide hydrolase